ncbi:hypothetical protein DM01DRAFT_278241, partial [Hesseltinella vesiculosa]
MNERFRKALRQSVSVAGENFDLALFFDDMGVKDPVIAKRLFVSSIDRILEDHGNSFCKSWAKEVKASNFSILNNENMDAYWVQCKLDKTSNLRIMKFYNDEGNAIERSMKEPQRRLEPNNASSSVFAAASLPFKQATGKDTEMTADLPPTRAPSPLSPILAPGFYSAAHPAQSYPTSADQGSTTKRERGNDLDLVSRHTVRVCPARSQHNLIFDVFNRIRFTMH